MPVVSNTVPCTHKHVLLAHPLAVRCYRHVTHFIATSKELDPGLFNNLCTTVLIHIT